MIKKFKNGDIMFVPPGTDISLIADDTIPEDKSHLK